MQMGAYDLMPRKTAAIYHSTGSIASSSVDTSGTSGSSSSHGGLHYGDLWRSKTFAFGQRSPRSSSWSSEERGGPSPPSTRPPRQNHEDGLRWTPGVPGSRLQALRGGRSRERPFLSAELISAADFQSSLFREKLFYSGEHLLSSNDQTSRSRPLASFLVLDRLEYKEKPSLQEVASSEEELTLSTVFQMLDLHLISTISDRLEKVGILQLVNNFECITLFARSAWWSLVCMVESGQHGGA
ncbi:hypothetical protein Btru_006647 [Bulinus truncatus]|nr:hypothetical protein Btru_006647 [Bulinus truncatus]